MSIQQVKISNKKVKDIIKELNFSGVQEIVKDTIITEVLSRISNFSDEVEHFEKKYKMNFLKFKKIYESGKEDYKKYDDLMNWQFAEEGKNYWGAKLNEVENVL